ncbi:MAG: tetratricopeptide repeat protein [Gemmataceae bacterium]|nr:tetratricopeptide repeat protein [Gemmataceae bacterium]
MSESQPPKVHGQPHQPARAAWVVCGALALAGLIAAWMAWPRAPVAAPDPISRPSAPPDDPRLTFSSRYRNVHPSISYVGDEACAHCHAEIAEAFRRHPMGQSLAPVVSATPAERHDRETRNPFDTLGFRYQVERRGGQVFHRETALDPQGRALAEIETPVDFAVGSATHGRGYLVNRDGYFFQSPITWYPQKGIWDLSPTYAARNHHFARPVTAECLFCHSNRALEVEHTVNRFRPPFFQGHAIGCERCHGPGALHIRRHENAEDFTPPDDSIVNPRHLSPVLREAVCQQCHLQGLHRVLRRGRSTFDFRPGLPLHPFLSVFVRPATPGRSLKFVGHVEQMQGSRCFQQSGGKLGCISCHDPHQQPTPQERVSYYRDRCLHCHTDAGCSVPVATRRQKSKEDSCVQCHMPAGGSEIAHTSITDHRIPRQADEGVPVDSRAPRLLPGEIPLVHFHKDQVAPDDPEVERDLAIALMDRVDRQPHTTRQELGRMALARLEAALERDPADLPAAEARATALWVQGRREAAAAAFATVLERAPRREAALHSAATLAMEMNQFPAAHNYWERAREVNPWRYEFHYGLAATQIQFQQWREAAASCRRALELNPAHLETRRLLVRCYLELGEKDQASAEFDRLLGLSPTGHEALRRWFLERSQ